MKEPRVRLRVFGEYACFTRPEMKVERVTYDVMTPSAARGVLEAVYWKPQMAWIIDEIHVRKPIRMSNVRRNEVGSRGPSARTIRQYMDGRADDTLAQCIEDDRQQRASTFLVDVEYLIVAHCDLLDPSEHPQKHYEVFKRRSQRGQHFHQPYLGCREFAANVEWCDHETSAVPDELRGDRDLGWMLYDIDYQNGNSPMFFRAKLRDGVLAVPSRSSKEIVR